MEKTYKTVFWAKIESRYSINDAHSNYQDHNIADCDEDIAGTYIRKYKHCSRHPSDYYKMLSRQKL